MEILTILTVVGVTALPWAAAGLLSKLKRCSAPLSLLSLSRPVLPGFGGVVAGLRAAQARARDRSLPDASLLYKLRFLDNLKEALQFYTQAEANLGSLSPLLSIHCHCIGQCNTFVWSHSQSYPAASRHRHGHWAASLL